ncbi:hypothetical protein Hsero_0555 [Herbaspirillum seropedicae SmR1]|uniref:Uncharacterized protein n=1 Tax=Herbaspirillum seropedicae (strain SmR1) TaxID=757424 RepID=D8IYB4_HERSS|nr:hypothetical protein Hsero_0555 [Herbaspirillum seropedicae SmR1]
MGLPACRTQGVETVEEMLFSIHRVLLVTNFHHRRRSSAIQALQGRKAAPANAPRASRPCAGNG